MEHFFKEILRTTSPKEREDGFLRMETFLMECMSRSLRREKMRKSQQKKKERRVPHQNLSSI